MQGWLPAPGNGGVLVLGTVLLVSLSLLTACAPPNTRPLNAVLPAQQEGVVRAIESEGARPGRTGGYTAQYQVLRVELATGDRTGEQITADYEQVPGNRAFQVGDRVVVRSFGNPDQQSWIVTDVVRWPALCWLAGAFLVMVALIGRRRGVMSIAGLAFSFLVLVIYVLPQLLAGADPVATSVTGATAIMIVTLYVAHGISRKTTVALISTAVSLVLTAVLASYALEWAWLTGLSDEGAYVLAAAPQAGINVKGLLLGGIIIGVLGVLDDITVSQSAIVFALHEANPDLGWAELYRRAMTVGSDHIASLVNTLVLAYAGAGLPLLLLFTTYDVGVSYALNQEIVATEVARTLLGSMGLVASVPVTSAMAAFAATWKRRSPTAERLLSR